MQAILSLSHLGLSDLLLFASSPRIGNNATFHIVNTEDYVGNVNVHFLCLKHLEGRVLHKRIKVCGYMDYVNKI